MPNFADLTAAIAALTEQVAATEGTTDSAVALIQGFSTAIQKAVEAALVADENADSDSIAAANTAIAEVTARFAAAGAKLGEAVAATPAP